MSRPTDYSSLAGGAGPAGGQVPTQQRPLTARGVVAIAPASESSQMTVVIGGMVNPGGQVIPAGNWAPRGASLPAIGDECLVVYDDSGDAFVPMWAGTSRALHELGDLIPSGAATRVGCLLCDGTAYTLSAHPELEALATACPVYVSGGILTVPNFFGRTAIGAGTGTAHGATAWALGAQPTTGPGGEQTHLLTTTEMPVHGHSVSDPTHTHPWSDSGFSVGVSNENNPAGAVGHYNRATGTPSPVGAASTGISIGNAGSGGEHNTLPPVVVVNWFIYAGT